MSVHTVARRYADALAEVAIERDQLETIDAEVRAFTELVQSNRELHDVFASPIVSNDEKRRVLMAVLERTRPGTIAANFLRTLAENGRLQYLGAVYGQFRVRINERLGIVPVEVTTAAVLGPEQRRALEQRIEQVTGKRIRVEFHTDAGLIGGVVTQIGSVVYDGSVRTQLQAFKTRLKTGTL